MAAPLVLVADLQLTLLNTVGLIWVGWLGRRVMLNRRRAAAKAGRPR